MTMNLPSRAQRTLAPRTPTGPLPSRMGSVDLRGSYTRIWLSRHIVARYLPHGLQAMENICQKCCILRFEIFLKSSVKSTTIPKMKINISTLIPLAQDVHTGHCSFVLPIFLTQMASASPSQQGVNFTC